MSTPQIDVAYIARLAQIDLTKEETDLFSQDLDKVLAYIAKLESYDVEGITPMNHPLPAMDVMRKDEPQPGLYMHFAAAGNLKRLGGIGIFYP